MIVINYLFILKERKYYYLAGFFLTLGIGFINKLLGQKIEMFDWIVMPLSCSFTFGFMIYHIVNNTDLNKKEGRYIIFTKDGMFHLALSVSTIVIVGLIGKLLNIK